MKNVLVIHFGLALLDALQLLIFPGMHDLCHRLLLRPQTLKLLHSQLKEILGVSTEAKGDASEFSIVPIFSDIEQFEILSILDEPDVVRLLSGLAGAVDGVDSNVFTIIGLAGVDHHNHMHVVFYADVSQTRHQRVLQLELLEPVSLLRKEELQCVDHHHVHAMLLDGIHNGGKDLVDGVRTIEVHEV